MLYFYISDVFVHPTQRGSGLGQTLVSELIDRIKIVAEPGATVALLSAPKREEFYELAGFQRCPNKIFGHGMAYLEPIERLLRDTNAS